MLEGSLLSQTSLTLSEIDAWPADECRPLHLGWCGSRCAAGQRACRSRARYRLLFSDPTSASELQFSKSAVFASYKHSFSLRQILCCIDKLNPQSKAAVPIATDAEMLVPFMIDTAEPDCFGIPSRRSQIRAHHGPHVAN